MAPATGLSSLSTAIAANAGIDIEIFHPSTGDPLGIIVHMQGSDSRAYEEADRQFKKQMVEHSKRTRDFSAGMDPDQQEAGLIKKMTACFLWWKERQADGTFKDTVTFAEGTELASTPENFRKIIKDRGLFWFRLQIQTGMDDTARFLPKAPPASPPQQSSDSATIDPERMA